MRIKSRFNKGRDSQVSGKTFRYVTIRNETLLNSIDADISDTLKKELRKITDKELHPYRVTNTIA